VAIASWRLPEAAKTPRPVVLVTGGSRGIGLALAKGFAARGYELFLIARDAHRLHAAAVAIERQFRVSVGHTPCDLTRVGAADGILAELAQAGRYVDVLVNCASISAPGDFAGCDLRAARSALALNIRATTDLMHLSLAGMMERRRGGVLNVASLAGMMPMPHLALYGATKAYLVALSRAVATEVAGTGVTVSVLLPGPVDTDFLARNMQVDQARLALLPALSADAVAHTAIEGFLAGQTVITPGFLGSLWRLGAKLLPYRVLAPVAGNVLRGLAPSEPAHTTPQAAARGGPIPSAANPEGKDAVAQAAQS
jgi:short-subunit dehydrogenase